jgi:hypothetical protein
VADHPRSAAASRATAGRIVSGAKLVKPSRGPDRGSAAIAPSGRRWRGCRACPPVVEISDEGLACTKAVCTYLYETFGRFPARVDTMHLMWLMQAHHLDLDFYDSLFGPGA